LTPPTRDLLKGFFGLHSQSAAPEVQYHLVSSLTVTQDREPTQGQRKPAVWSVSQTFPSALVQRLPSGMLADSMLEEFLRGLPKARGL